MIYIVEDDLNIRQMESYALKNSGYLTEEFDDGVSFSPHAKKSCPILSCWTLCCLETTD